MPPILIPILTAAGVTGSIAIGTATISYAAILAYTITTAATVGASLLLGQTQKKQRGDPQQVTVKQAMPPRTRSYGRVKIGGAIAFIETNIGTMYQAVIHGQGQWDGIEEWWLNDKNAQLSGGAVGVLPWGSNISITTYLGSDSQAASTTLTSNFSPLWGTDHRLRGLAYSVISYGWIQEKFFSKVYPNGAPQLRVVARTMKVLDPRSGLVVFSENPALCIMDFLTHVDGMGLPLSSIDQISFGAFADICDQPVLLVAGGTEPRYRYRIGFTYDLTQEPREVLRLMLASCDGEIYPAANGKVGIRGGAWSAPTVTLRADHITGYQYEQGNDRLSAFNRLKLTFTDRSADYQPVEAAPWEDLASQADVGVMQQDLSLTQVPSWTQARRLGKIATYKGNPRHRLTLRTNLAGLAALGERMVRVELDEIDLADDFLIERFEIAGDLSGCEMTLASLPAETYAWNPAAEEGPAPSAPQDTSTANTPPATSGGAVTLVRRAISAGTAAVFIRATVTPPTQTIWQLIGRYRKSGATAWTDMAPDGDWAVISAIVEDNAVYEVQVAFAGYGGINSGNVGSWSATQTVTVINGGNLIAHSDDAANWVIGAGDNYALGGSPVADPLGTTKGRGITFSSANIGYLYATAQLAGTNVSGRTFAGSLWVRKPASGGKNQIVLGIISSTGEKTTQVITLTSTWTRYQVVRSFGGSATSLWLEIDNRTAAYPTLDGSTGTVEVFGAQIEEAGATGSYQSRS